MAAISRRRDSSPRIGPFAQRRIATRVAATHCAAQQRLAEQTDVPLDDLAPQAQNAVETLLARAASALRERVSEGGV